MKKIIAFMMCAALFGAAGVSAEDDAVTVIVNGQELTFEDAQPYIENERTLVPLRAVFEALGAEVEWDGDTGTVTSYDSQTETSIILKIGDFTMSVNGNDVEMDVAPKIVDDSTMIPLRAVAESMDCDVNWSQKERTVYIRRDTSAAIANPWSEYANVTDLNNALETYGCGYAVKDITLSTDRFTPHAYRYLSSAAMSEIQYEYKDEITGDTAKITLRKAVGDGDISGIYGGLEVEEITGENGLPIRIYRFDNGFYATWTYYETDDGADAAISNSVTIAASEADDDYIVNLLTSVVNNL